MWCAEKKLKCDEEFNLTETDDSRPNNNENQAHNEEVLLTEMAHDEEIIQ